MPGSSSTAHSTAHNSTASTPSTEKLDRNSTARQPSTLRRMQSALTGSTGPRQLLDRLDKARQARPRQRPRQRLDGASTARQLDSQGSTARSSPKPERTGFPGCGLIDHAHRHAHDEPMPATPDGFSVYCLHGLRSGDQLALIESGCVHRENRVVYSTVPVPVTYSGIPVGEKLRNHGNRASVTNVVASVVRACPLAPVHLPESGRGFRERLRRSYDRDRRRTSRHDGRD